MPFPCLAHAIPLPCRAANGLECAFPIWFTQCGRVWLTLAMPRPCHALTMPFFSRPQHSTAVSHWPCCGLEKNGMAGAWHGHGMTSVNQTWPHCVNEMGKTHSKPLVAQHGRGMGIACYVWISFYWAESGLHNGRTVGEANVAAVWSHPHSSEPVTKWQNKHIGICQLVYLKTWFYCVYGIVCGKMWDCVRWTQLRKLKKCQAHSIVLECAWWL